MSEKNLQGKVAVVSGAARGIGRAIALELAGRGADLAICDLLQAGETVAAVESLGVRCFAQQTDVGDRAQAERLFEATGNRFGRVDIVVNNAAQTVRKPLVDLLPEDVEKTWRTTQWGPFHFSQLGARMMIAQGQGGSIVSITSVLAHIPHLASSPYNGAKAAVNQMTRTWALELAPHGIRVNAIEPGWTDTPGERAFASEEELRAGGEALPLGRLGSAQDIAKAVAFLVSADASYITGAAIPVDGGISLIR